MQLCFSLPVPNGAAAEAAAAALVGKMGMERVQVVHRQELDAHVTFFTVFARCRHEVNFRQFEDLVPERPCLSQSEIEERLAKLGLGEVVLVGAATGTDTHSVGLDAILNLKGYHGEHGLEAYKGLQVHNLGSQVPNEDLLERAAALGAHAVLVSQTVTQQDLHKKNLAALRAAARKHTRLRNTLFICGGPHLEPELARELDYDACFGRGCTPAHVATFLVEHFERQLTQAN